MLVGMLQNPAMYNPVRRTEKTFTRRSVVLKQMEKAGFITEQEYDSLKNLPLLPKRDINGNYKLASTLGILTFIVCSVVSLITYRNSSASKNEEDFQ